MFYVIEHTQELQDNVIKNHGNNNAVVEPAKYMIKSHKILPVLLKYVYTYHCIKYRSYFWPSSNI